MSSRRPVRLFVSALIGATLTITPACVVRARSPVWVVDVAPPPPRSTGVMVARPGHVWIEGNWAWVDGRWFWQQGRWERERMGHVWLPGAWIHASGRWHWRAGRWDRHHDRRPPPSRARVRDHR